VRSLVAYTYRAVISIEVTLQQLAQTLTRYGFAYFLTVGDDARAHVLAVTTTLANDTLLVTDLGRTTASSCPSPRRPRAAAQPVIERTQRGYVPPSMLKTWLVT
jgi:hypothetical protein